MQLFSHIPLGSTIGFWIKWVTTNFSRSLLSIFHIKKLLPQRVSWRVKITFKTCEKTYKIILPLLIPTRIKQLDFRFSEQLFATTDRELNTKIGKFPLHFVINSVFHHLMSLRMNKEHVWQSVVFVPTTNAYKLGHKKAERRFVSIGKSIELPI